jgi:hypothetical protein
MILSGVLSQKLSAKSGFTVQQTAVKERTVRAYLLRIDMIAEDKGIFQISPTEARWKTEEPRSIQRRFLRPSTF